ncbi:MAG: VWA domain-containing protein [Acidobacteriota bacterium]|nr:VWA domain-containing protein [Acidobacteriota bacterium]
MFQPDHFDATWKLTRCRRRRWSLNSLLLIAWLVFAGASAGIVQAEGPEQIPADEPLEAFGEVIEVRLVEVEVVVTGARGRRVPGLRAEDFELLVDGEPQSVDYFSEVRDNRQGQRTEEPVEESEDGAAAPGEPATGDAVQEPVHSWLVFIDDYFTHRAYRGLLLERLLRDVESLNPGDRMAVVRYAGWKLEVLTPWTSSKAQLRRAIEDVQALEPGEQRRRAQLDAWTSINDEGAERAELESRDLAKVVNAASVTLRSFAQAEGRKLFVLMTSGWPYDPGPIAVSEPIDRSFLEQLRAGNLARIRSVSDVANLVGYTIYPLHLGLAPSPVNAASSGPSGGSSLDFGTRAKRDSLSLLAEETGGAMMTYAVAKPTLPVEWVQEDTRAYYVLGFSPRIVRDGGRHEVEVRVRGRGLKTRHRSGYRDLTRQEQASLATEAVLLQEGSVENTLEVSFGEARKIRLGSARVPMTVRIPMDWVTMLPVSGAPANGVHHASLRLRVAVVDDRGNQSELAVVPVRFQGEKPEPGEVAVYETEVKLRREKHTLAVSLEDTLSNEMLTSRVELDL